MSRVPSCSFAHRRRLVHSIQRSCYGVCGTFGDIVSTTAPCCTDNAAGLCVLVAAAAAARRDEPQKPRRWRARGRTVDCLRDTFRYPFYIHVQCARYTNIILEATIEGIFAQQKATADAQFGRLYKGISSRGLCGFVRQRRCGEQLHLASIYVGLGKSSDDLNWYVCMRLLYFSIRRHPKPFHIKYDN